MCRLLQATALPNLEFEVRITIGAAAIKHGSKEVIDLHHVKKKSHIEFFVIILKSNLCTALYRFIGAVQESNFRHCNGALEPSCSSIDTERQSF